MTSRIPSGHPPFPDMNQIVKNSEPFSNITGLFNKIPVVFGVTADCQPGLPYQLQTDYSTFQSDDGPGRKQILIYRRGMERRQIRSSRQ